MNELIAPELSQLPALPIEEVKQTVDKVGAYVDALAAAKKAVTDQNTINEIDEQIRKYSAFKIRCQMELGKRTSEIKTKSGRITLIDVEALYDWIKYRDALEIGVPVPEFRREEYQ